MPAVPTPPLSLRAALDRQEEKPAAVDWIFSRVAQRYDLGNDILSLGWHTRWKRRLVTLAAVGPHERVLDIATGTGDIALMLSGAAEVIGIDNNEAMLSLARQKQSERGMSNVRFVNGDAGALPFEDGAFDVVTCSYAGRGFASWEAVLGEVYRVLAPGGRFLNLDFARPVNRWWDRTYRWWLIASGAVLGATLHGNPKIYVYIPLSMVRYPGQRWLDARMRDAGFETELIETTACLMAYNIGKRPR